jgi:hypothetical protein
LALWTTACGSSASNDEAMYSELADSVDAALMLGNLLPLFASPEIADGLTGTADEYAAVAADAAPLPFSPIGCATASALGGTMTITFDGCHGPGVLHDVTGTLHVAYQVGPADCIGCAQKIEAVEYTATELRGNGLDLDITPATITVRGPRGYTFDMGGQLLTTVAGPCTTLERDDRPDVIWTLDGMYTNETTQHYVSAFGFQRCTGGCPTGNVWRHMSEVAGEVRGTGIPPLRYLGGPQVDVVTLSGPVTVDALCD